MSSYEAQAADVGRAADLEIQSAAQRIGELTARISELVDQAALDDGTIRDLEAERDELRAQIAALTPKPPTPPVPPVPPVPAKPTVKFGMASGADAEFNKRVLETGPVHARRNFVPAISQALALVKTAHLEKAAGRYAVLSSKFTVPWVSVPAKGANPSSIKAQLDALVTAMKAEPVTRDDAFWCFEHEPQGNSGGTGPEYAAAQAYVIDYLATRVSNWRFGIILNGFPFSPGPMHQSDEEIAAGYCPDSLIAVLNEHDAVLGADCYHGGSFQKPLEGAGPKIRGLSAWATRKGVKNLGIGEYNGLTAASITDAQTAIKADPRFVFACIYNTDLANRADLGGSWVLTGDRLAAFKAAL